MRAIKVRAMEKPLNPNTAPEAPAPGVGSQAQAQAAPTNVLIVGVGGQGVVLISKMLARLCQISGHEVKQSEVHGMAKRGGVVFSHVRFGGQVWAPTIPRGQADILVALEWAEGLRWLPYLKRESGTFISDTKQIVPPFAFRNRQKGAAAGYVDTSVAEVAQAVPNCIAVDATTLAQQLGNARAANTVLLGILSTALDFPEAAWHPVLREFAPPGTAELNLRAFTLGRQTAVADAGANGGPAANRANPAQPLPKVPAVPPAGPVTLEIVEAWCKACDICVKMCPERCLELNGMGVVTLAEPGACTGCRICEMLCPDFAIRVMA